MTLSRMLVLACAALAIHCGAPAPHARAPVALDDDARAGVVHLNRVRAAMGLHDVALDPEMSRKAELHARYLAQNAGRPEIAGLAAHHQVPTLPGYTPDGAEAGQASVIAFNDALAPAAIETWLSTLYHRIPLLRRDVLRIGIGHVGTIHVLMLDDARSPAEQAPVLFPRPAQRDVPALFSLGEVPEPRPAAWFGTMWADAVAMRSGYPVTVTFDRRSSISQVRATLADEAGAVEVAVSSPAAPATSFPQGPVVAMLPRHPLRAATTYRAMIEYLDRGVPGRLAWEFRTADPIAVDAAHLVPPPAGAPIVLAGVVSYAHTYTLCESAEPTRCRTRLEVELGLAAPGAVVPKIDLLDGETDADRVLGLVGRQVRARGHAEYAGPQHLGIQIESAAALEVLPDDAPAVAVDAVDAARSGHALRVTGALAITPAVLDRTNYIAIGREGRVFVQASAATWEAVFAKLGGSRKKLVSKRVIVRGVLRQGAPTATGLYLAVSHPAQIELAP